MLVSTQCYAIIVKVTKFKRSTSTYIILNFRLSNPEIRQYMIHNNITSPKILLGQFMSKIIEELNKDTSPIFWQVKWFFLNFYLANIYIILIIICFLFRK